MEFCYRARSSADPLLPLLFRSETFTIPPVPAGDEIGKIAFVDIRYRPDFCVLECFPYQGELGNTYG